MAGVHKVFYVVTAPPVSADRPAAECLARALGMSTYDARLKLAAPAPQILSAAANRSDAVELQMALEEVGVPTRCFSHAEIVHRPPTYDAVGCYLGANAAVFDCKEEFAVRAAYEDVKVIVKARVRCRAVKKIDGLKRAGIWTRARGESHADRETMLKLLLYMEGPRVVRISQHEFNYACLGGGMSMSSLRNFETLSSLLRKRFVRASFDDSLCRAAARYEKVGEEYSSGGADAGRKRERKEMYSDERFVLEAAWMIALVRWEEGDQPPSA